MERQDKAMRNGRSEVGHVLCAETAVTTTNSFWHFITEFIFQLLALVFATGQIVCCLFVLNGTTNFKFTTKLNTSINELIRSKICSVSTLNNHHYLYLIYLFNDGCDRKT